MDGEIGEVLIRWTARLAVACYALRLLIEVILHSTLRRERLEPVARWIWTAGCGIFLLHIVAAFHFEHGWSHAAAWEDTARQTAAVTGLNWGGGLWFNYAFAILWIADVAAWWAAGTDWPRRHRGVYWVVQGIFAFMVFNATVVFGPPWWSWASVAVVVGLFIAWWLGQSKRTSV